jgi:2-C-methyl-D-erythritol 4-phosphate cytidylyltransferase
MKPSIWVIIPAAGKGTRFNSERPKQYCSLMGLSVLQQTLKRFQLRSDIKGMVLALSSDDIQQYSYPEFEGIKIVLGGIDRASSVYNAMVALESMVEQDDLIAVHDAARPCIRQSSLNALFVQAYQHPDGVILASLATDTIKYVNADFIEKTLDRNHVWSAQTPQIFRYDLLRQALEFAKSQQVAITDEASAVELLGFKPMVVQDRKDNIKITYEEDLELAAFFLDKIQKEND